MRVCVIADGVAARGNFARKFWKFTDMGANQKKSGADGMSGEQVEERGCDGGIRAVVKCERDGVRITR